MKSPPQICPMYLVLFKSTVEISQNFVAFSEYMNFTKTIFWRYDRISDLLGIRCEQLLIQKICTLLIFKYKDKLFLATMDVPFLRLKVAILYVAVLLQLYILLH